MEACSQCGGWFLPAENELGDDRPANVCIDCWEPIDAERPIGAAYERGWYDGYKVGERNTRRALGHEPKVAAPAPARESLPLRDVLKLCHPDWHPPERGTLATRVTQIILEVISREKGGAA